MECLPRGVVRCYSARRGTTRDLGCGAPRGREPLAAAGSRIEHLQGVSMSEPIQTIEPAKGVHQPKSVAPTPPDDKPVWETPKLEDVSEQVMAQPYIRFT